MNQDSINSDNLQLSSNQTQQNSHQTNQECQMYDWAWPIKWSEARIHCGDMYHMGVAPSQQTAKTIGQDQEKASNQPEQWIGCKLLS